MGWCLFLFDILSCPFWLFFPLIYSQDCINLRPEPILSIRLVSFFGLLVWNKYFTDGPHWRTCIWRNLIQCPCYLGSTCLEALNEHLLDDLFMFVLVHLLNFYRPLIKLHVLITCTRWLLLWFLFSPSSSILLMVRAFPCFLSLFCLVNQKRHRKQMFRHSHKLVNPLTRSSRTLTFDLRFPWFF